MVFTEYNSIESSKMLSGKQIFKLINQQADYKFIYRSNLLKYAPKFKMNQGEIKADELLKAYLGPELLQLQNIFYC